jgi:isopropylmalate/homocitrate/citramalate synthase
MDRKSKSLFEIDTTDRPSTANLLTGQFEGHIEPSVAIWDNTLREGEQPPGVVFTADEKLEIASALDDFGVAGATIGFPAASQEELRACQRIVKSGVRMKTSAMARILEGDIQAARDSGVDMVGLFASGSDTHLRDKLRMTEDEVLAKLEKAARLCNDMRFPFYFGLEDATRMPLPRILRWFQLCAEAGAQTLVLADTVGILTPTSASRIIHILRALLPRSSKLCLHFHNDLGLALANSLAGLEAGAEMAHATVNGAGERAGNTCLEELAVVLTWKYGLNLGLKLERIQDLCNLVHRASGTRPSEHKPITGKWNFTHESGIHVHGILANPETYQPFPPKMVGRSHEIVLGKHSGGQSVAHLSKNTGVELSASGRDEVLKKIKLQAERKQEVVTEEQVLDWIRLEASTARG